jgi:hypothetical protein
MAWSDVSNIAIMINVFVATWTEIHFCFANAGMHAWHALS